jgi:hypothetical protein
MVAIGSGIRRAGSAYVQMLGDVLASVELAIEVFGLDRWASAAGMSCLAMHELVSGFRACF